MAHESDVPGCAEVFKCTACLTGHTLVSSCPAVDAHIDPEEEYAYEEAHAEQEVSESSLDMYGHFDIPRDVPKWQQEAMLEAAMGSS